MLMVFMRPKRQRRGRAPKEVLAGAVAESEISKRCCVMVKTWKPQTDELVLPIFLITSAMLAVGGAFFLLIFSLSQPTIYSNPGVAAYTPPPRTTPLPLPRKSDAPELTELSDEPTSPLTALAQAQTSGKQVKPIARPPVRKHPRSDPREIDQRRWGYPQQGNYEYRDWYDNRAWGGGGFKTKF